ncbi:MAG: DUF134 domain-containing protein [Spirochaetia bacterium]
MPRPRKCRKICCKPSTTLFKPAGIAATLLEQVTLTVDEFESIRLADQLGLYQKQAADQMQVSRQTFGNILSSARKKIADALVNSKALRINGGNVEMGKHSPGCGHLTDTKD